jgi:hypothetical protein
VSGAGSLPWRFKARFRRHAFGWKSQPAILRVKEAVAEIRKVARTDLPRAAEGAVSFLERVSPAIERVDGSSGAIGTAVYRAVEELVPVIAMAPADAATRDGWLERLFEAHGEDLIPYIESLADYWGDLCASPGVASAWADRLLDITRLALGPDRATRGHFHGTSACLSALYSAGRHEELVALLRHERFWHYRRWAVRSLAALGMKAEALRLAEESRGQWTSDLDVDQHCEEILLSSGMIEEAYSRYGLTTNRGGTYLSTFRAVARKYPDKGAGEILADLARSTPGGEGKWFAAAKEAGLFDEALALAARSPCDPRTLSRAARDHVADRPDFSLGAGILALRWLLGGHGYEIAAIDVREACAHTMAAAERLGRAAEVRETIRKMMDDAREEGGFVTGILSRALQFSR